MASKKKSTKKKKVSTKKKKTTVKKKKSVAKGSATSKNKRKVPMGTKDLGNGFSATIYPPSINYKIEW